MADYVEVSVAAINTVTKTKLSSEDREIPGVYKIHVPTLLTTEKMAAIAMDVFHIANPVKAPGDFEFVVFDPVGGVVLEEDEAHESYSSDHMGRDGGRTVERLPLFYDVLVESVAKDGTVNRVGEKTFAAHSERQAKVKALNMLWSPKLDGAGCSPRASVKRCRF